MLIRSQDKRHLINIDGVKEIYYNEISGKYRFKASFSYGAWEDIGVYSTKVKADKILDMMQGEYESSVYCDHAFDQSANVERPYIFMENKVFQMPTDEEMDETVKGAAKDE
jgi:hypothetical protein